jgi:aspartate aminotransferase
MSLSVQSADRLKSVRPSVTHALSAKAQALRKQGKSVVHLGVGDPDFDMPFHIKAASIDAIHEGYNKYMPGSGHKDLKEAVCLRYKRDCDLLVTPEEVLITAGAKQALSAACFALLNPGDEVIVPSPYWVSYLDVVQLAGGKPVVVKTTPEHRYLLTPEQLEAAITPKTKLLILNTPNNPSGMAYTEENLKALAAVIKKHPHLIVLDDAVYDVIMWNPDKYVNFRMTCPDIQDQVVLINSLSKTYAMTGWRVGYSVQHPDLTKLMGIVASQTTTCVNGIAQMAGVEALSGKQDAVKKMVAQYHERYTYLFEHVSTMPGFVLQPTDGTFFLLPDASGAIKFLGLKDDVALCAYLIEKVHVVLLPGSACGMPGHVRISFASSMETLKLFAQRMDSIFRQA